MADHVRGASIRHQQWIAVDGVGDSARLVRAIGCSTLASDALLNVLRPRGGVAAFMGAHALPISDAERGDYFCPVTGPMLTELAAVIERQVAEPPCAGIFVVQDGSHVIEAFRRDGGEDVVWVAADLPPFVIAQFRDALDGARLDVASPAEQRSHGYKSAPEGMPRMA